MSSKERKQRRISQALWVILAVEVVLVGLLVFYFYVILPKPKKPVDAQVVKKEIKKAPEIKTGKILKEEPAKKFTPQEVQGLIGQTNKKFDSPIGAEVTKQVFSFNSSDGKVDNVPIYARAYVPSGTDKKPVFAFAPGTTGIADSCAASLENPSKADWANYDSLLMAYASQGYVVVTIDYEGMRDSARIHHYMVGDLEGRALLDSIRALKNLALTKDQINDEQQFSAGYSQGGHASYWADQIKDDYAPELKLLGSIGFGPVTSVEETLDDAINGANINWFGSLVLTSYNDWYKTPYPVDKILQPKFAKNFKTDAQSLCIDAFTKLWPSNRGQNRSAEVYTPEFSSVAKKLNIAENPIYQSFSTDLAKNIVGNVKTDRPKLINHGIHDDVVLVTQSQHGFERMCVKGNTVKFNKYDTSPNAIQGYNPSGRVDHYQTMNASFKDTLAWMQNIIAGKKAPTSCQ
jgi:hypothetical protein